MMDDHTILQVCHFDVLKLYLATW